MRKLSYVVLVKWRTVAFFFNLFTIFKLFYLLYSKLFYLLYSKLFVHFILNYLFAIF